ncbi:hypothetical protein CCAND93_930001 [Capnocytophaga canis]|uniref:Uncharacterized protein n=1 Tax=Capnocytophaga canis TaxID=1848903 RepID=A0A0B7IV37_9FLAO|nr:hypothetical protein CCAND93_930001 [Capnocytophaga canis]
MLLAFNKNTTLFPDCQIFIPSYFLKHDHVLYIEIKISNLNYIVDYLFFVVIHDKINVFIFPFLNYFEYINFTHYGFFLC